MPQVGTSNASSVPSPAFLQETLREQNQRNQTGTMSSMNVRNNLIVVSKGLHLDLYDQTKHIAVDVPSKSQENDAISDVVISPNCEHLAVITSTSKQLIVYDLPELEKYRSFILPRSASKIRFATNNQKILVADKSGDVLLYNVKEEDSGTKLLGHLSLLLDILQTDNEKYIITSDRDEKIKVSCYPNTYNIQTYCLGHKEFVNHLELLPHNSSYLTSTSGDGHIKCWDYITGKLCYSIDTYQDVNDSDLKESFMKSMDTERVEVETLPIVHYAVTKLDNTSSLLITTVYGYNHLLLYRLTSENSTFSHSLVQKLKLDSFPTAVACHEMTVCSYDINENEVSIYKILQENDTVGLKFETKIKMFENISTSNPYPSLPGLKQFLKKSLITLAVWERMSSDFVADAVLRICSQTAR
ncbi:hypothetical protein NE865_09844 [Phthorimaea operculella]|nr:hypothetical protein NE865_09844 [Phthorimaea operculella]